MYKNNAYNKKNIANVATINISDNVLKLTGTWDWENIDEKKIQAVINLNLTNIHTIDATSIVDVDTIGIYFINKIYTAFKIKNNLLTLQINPEIKKLHELIANKLINLDNTIINKNSIGLSMNNTPDNAKIFFINIISFLGQLSINSLKAIIHPLRIGWQEVTRVILNTGVNGIFVILLLNFLIGTTLAYEMAPQFIQYGANIYIVNFLGIAMLKEVSPLLTAIIIAGRSGSSITAEIGMMKVQEEIDAIRTMGISPIQYLVMPKIIGIMLATPLLTALADIVGVFGGAIIANNKLGMSYTFFINRMQNNVSIHNYTDGLLKSVAFGLSIGFIGCYCGFTVKNNSISVGENTTQSVVLSIILIIILDAIFATIFLKLGK